MFMAAALSAGCASVSANAAATVRTASPTADVRTGAPRLILAVESVQTYSDPLWVGWPKDRPALAALQKAWRSARRVGEIIPQGVPTIMSEVPALHLGFSDGELITVTPYYRKVQAGSDQIRPSKTYVTVSIPGHRYPERMRAPLLASVLSGSKGGLHYGPFPTAKLTRSGMVQVQGGGAVGPSVTLLASPEYGDQIGGGEGGAGSFPIAAVPVNGGNFRWRGRIHLPRHYVVYHPVVGWSVAVEVHPFWKFSLFIDPVLFGTPLSAGVMPRVRPAPVRTAAAALAAVEGGYSLSPFPVWPTGPGRENVVWETYDNKVYRGSEQTTVTSRHGEFRVVIQLDYRDGSSQTEYSTTWLVEHNGRLTQVAQVGDMPLGGFKRILRP